MQRLKQETRSEHLALEAQLPLMSPDLTLAQYRAVLRAFASVILPLEQRLEDCCLPAALGYPARRHTSALQRDLTVLGLDAPPHPLPDTLGTRAPAVYGTLYVLEGSTLGGQLISRHLHRHLHLTATTGAAYFAGYGPDTGPKWRAFHQFMLETVQPEWSDAILAEARTAFQTFSAAVSVGKPA